MKKNFTFTLVASSDKLSLKQLIANRLSGAAVLEDLSIQIILVEDVCVSLVDDLLDYDICNSKIEVVLNKASSINYQVKISENKDNINFEQTCKTSERVLSFYDKQKTMSKELNFKFIGQHSSAHVTCSVKGTNDRIIKIKTT